MSGLGKAVAFFGYLRKNDLLGPVLSQDEVSGCNAILNACGARDWPTSHVAYALATAYHETAHTLRPIRELGGDAYFRRMYDPQGRRPAVAAQLGNTQPGDGSMFHGRGYVQITGRANYLRAGRELVLPLVRNPDLAMRADVAAKILERGMDEGWFTGGSCHTYLPDERGTRGQFIRARRIINGTDRAGLIADYAVQFQDALIAGEWS